MMIVREYERKDFMIDFKVVRKEMEWGGRKLVLETGKLARQAQGAVVVTYGETEVIATVCAAKEAKADQDFFPLTVNYQEKYYATGKVPGGFMKREGKPSEREVLLSRLIDRPIRPLFAEGFRNEVQVVNTVLSVDTDCTPEMTGMFGASLALGLSDIPFNGPIAGVYVGYVDGEYIINPSVEELSRSRITLAVAGTKDAINMVESSATEVNEEEMLEAILFGHENIKKLCAFQEEIIAACGKPKREITLYEIPSDLNREVREMVQDRLVEAVRIHEKLERYGKIDDLEDETAAVFEAREYEDEKSKQTTLKFVHERKCLFVRRESQIVRREGND